MKILYGFPAFIVCLIFLFLLSFAGGIGAFGFMALVFLAGGTACGIYAVITHAVATIVFAVLGLGLGVALLLCWRNQTIRILSEEQFVYKTMFGREHTYNFADIQGIRPNKDSVTLFVAGEKVHMESMAVLSEELVRKLNAALNNLNNQEEKV